MKVLIVGGSGFIGTSLADVLARRGVNALVGYRSRPYAWTQVSRSHGRAVQVDLADTNAWTRLLDVERPDTVVHLASTMVPASNAAEYLDEREGVINPTARLLLELADRDIKLIFSSSGGAIYGQSDAPTCRETDFCNPISLYGQAKLEIEGLILFLHRTRGLRHLILRPSNPFGGTQSMNGRQGLIAKIMGCLIRGEALDVWGNGEVIRDYLYIDDLNETISYLMLQADAEGVVNIGSGVGHTLLEVVQTAESIIGRSITLNFRESRPVDVSRVVLDVSKAAALGAPHPRSLADGISAYAKALGAL